MVALLACTGSLSAQTLPAGVTRGASVEGVTEYRLQNGLRVLLFPDPARATTTVNIVYLAGSRHEDYGDTGIAHLVEHLVSYGSPRHPDAKAEQAARGAQRNASTSYDRTNYYESFPASDENLAWAIDLEADRMRGAPIKREILASQMSVVRNEMERGENDPERILFQRLRSTAYLWHNYGKSTIGTRSDVEQVPIERLQAFYDRHYHPDNAVLIIAGKLDPARTLGWVAEKFGPIPRSAQPIPATYTVEPTQDGERSIVLRRVGDVQALHVGYHVPAGSHPDHGPVRVLMDVLTGSPNGRLFKALVETKQATAVGSSARGLREASYAVVEARLRKEQSLDGVRATILQTLDGLATNPPTAEEVSRSREKLVRQAEQALADSSAVGFALGEAAAVGDWRLVFLQRDWLRSVTPAEVARVAKTYFVPSNRTVASFIPETEPLRAEIPPAPAIETLVANYKGDDVVAAGEAIDPSPAALEARIQRAKWPGGLNVALLPKQTRGAVVRAELTLRFGDPEQLRGKRATSMAAGTLLIRGTVNRSRQQIADELTRLKARMFTAGGVGSVTLTLETVRANLPAVLALAAEVLREPAFASVEFERYQQQQIAAYEAQRGDPQTLAGLQLQRHFRPLPADNPRAVLLPDEAIAGLRAVTVEDVKTFWREVAGASNGEFVVVGDFDAAAVQQLGQQLFGSWKSPRPYRSLPREAVKAEPVNELILTPDKANAYFTAGLQIAVTDAHADYPALALAGYMLGGHSASRLYLRIRGKDGLSYGPSASFTVAPRERLGTFTASAIANPPNIPKVELAFREEMERVLKDGFAADEVERARNGWLQSRQLQRSRDETLLSTLQSQARYGRTMQFIADLDRKVGELTAAQVTEALRRHFDLAQVSVFKAGDFKKGAE